MVNTKFDRVTLLFVCIAVATIGCAEKADSPAPLQTNIQTEPTPTLPQTTQEPRVVPEPEPTPTAAVGPEPEPLVAAVSIAAETNRRNGEDTLPPVPLDVAGATEFLDLRGVGDAAMAETTKNPII